ncbi:MAG: hypothetical protein ACD_24C00322G0002 [uncultured bacterium]|nr:MAG: hypothetical protein ACD_24C00322G0002 [uncultured bacterium]
MYLIIHEIGHFLFYISVIFSILLLFRKTGKKLFTPKYLFIGLVSTLLIDLDHLIDYFLYYGFSFNLHDFALGTQFAYSGKVYVFFHSWELLLLLLTVGFYLIKKKNKYILFVITLGMLSHVLYDTAYYSFSVVDYSLIYRILRNFDISVFRGY